DAPEAEAVRGLIEGRERNAKPYVTARLLRLRRERPALFEGDYRALEPEGTDAWLAFARETEGDALVVLAPRFPAREPAGVAVPLPETLAGHGWTEWLTGAVVAATERLDPRTLPLPWAVLVRA
ncbi:MAG TPA: hypothetical protein VK002_12930, partial [Rubricoccaceae bacterium]|nr:hypothetical protein [Rubricoccaceae bacterium]